jgi:hypothetical protein
MKNTIIEMEAALMGLLVDWTWLRNIWVENISIGTSTNEKQRE